MITYILQREQFPRLIAAVENILRGNTAHFEKTLADVGAMFDYLLRPYDEELLWSAINEVLAGVQLRRDGVCDTRMKALMAWLVEDKLNASQTRQNFIHRVIDGTLHTPVPLNKQVFPFKETVNHYQIFAIFGLLILHGIDGKPSSEDLRDIHQLLIQAQLSKQIALHVGNLADAEKRWEAEKARSQGVVTLAQHTQKARNVKEQRDAEMQRDAISLYVEGLADNRRLKFGKWKLIDEAIEEIFGVLLKRYKIGKKRFLVDSPSGRQTMGRWFRPYSEQHRQGKLG